jgi:dihydrofolate reductase
MGRKTYEGLAAVWPGLGNDPALGRLADRINSMPKYVASRTLEDLEWENSHLIDGDLPEAVAELKDQPGGHLVVYGGHDLIRALREHGLIDEYRLLVQPVVLGKGRSLFGDGAERMDLELGDTTVISPGVVILTYRLDGRAA